MNKRLLALLLTLTLALACVCLAEDASAPGETEPQTQDPAPQPTQEPAEVPTEAPAEAPTAAPTEKPAEESSEVPSEEPAPSPTPEPGEVEATTPEVNPTSTPESAPTDTSGPIPTDSPEPAPTDTSEPETTPAPDASPTPVPGFAILPEAGVQREDGVWLLSFAAPEDELTFRWTSVDGASSYEWMLMDGEGQLLLSGSQAETELKLTARDCGEGTRTLIVRARTSESEEDIGEARLDFELTAQGGALPGFPGGRPGGFGGFTGGRSSSGAGFDGDMPQEEQGFHVTPGVALTDAHASGSKDMSNYGAANLSLSEDPVAWLALSGDAADVRRADGNSFTAALEEDTLTLSCSDATAEWVVNPLALTALRQSGAKAELRGGERRAAHRFGVHGRCLRELSDARLRLQGF